MFDTVKLMYFKMLLNCFLFKKYQLMFFYVFFMVLMYCYRK